MGFQSDTHHYFSSSSCSEELWDRLHKKLSTYGITAVFYGVSHVPLALKMDGSWDLFYFKTSYPESLLATDSDNFSINDDISAVHCTTKITPFFWNEKSCWLSSEERKKRSAMDSYWYKEPLRVGVSIPLRFSNHGVGGIGMYAANLSCDEFDQEWDKSKDEIMAIAYIFDEIARAEFSELVGIKLSKREKEVISYLSEGYSAKKIANKIGTKPNTVQNQVAAAREKLHASNNVQLVTKALALSLI